MKMKKMIKTLCLTALLIIANGAMAQSDTIVSVKPFKHLDLNITTGTTGLGIELGTPISDMFSVRAGYSFVPKFHHNMDFAIQVGEEAESKWDENGNRVETKFDRLAKRLEEVTGMTVDDNVRMIGEPTFHNWHLLVDVRPFRNKSWHLTTGFYFGPSDIAKAYNSTEEMQTLMGVNLYNNIYDKVLNREPIYGDIYLSPWEGIGEQLIQYGRMGILVGEFANQYKTDSDGNIMKDADGNPIRKTYFMEPDADGMVKATMKVNSFKPYLGFGYGGRISKKSDEYYISFDCGVMFWGGKPDLITHDGTNLSKDVIIARGDVKSYVDLMNKFCVYPVINLKLTKRIF